MWLYTDHLPNLAFPARLLNWNSLTKSNMRLKIRNALWDNIFINFPETNKRLFIWNALIENEKSSKVRFLKHSYYLTKSFHPKNWDNINSSNEFDLLYLVWQFSGLFTNMPGLRSTLLLCSTCSHNQEVEMRDKSMLRSFSDTSGDDV